MIDIRTIKNTNIIIKYFYISLIRLAFQEDISILPEELNRFIIFNNRIEE